MIVIKNRLDSHKQISPNFKAYELECHCRDCNISVVSEDLLNRLEILRRLWGKPVSLTSCYRCYLHNKAVGGKTHSWHLSGSAADIVFPDKDRSIFIKLCSKIFSYSYIEDTFIHVDVRS